MNYRHAFHAGNFADVVKHAILTRILTYLMKKDAAFRVIDTHAGIGGYDLTGEIAKRSPEWKDGIGRLLNAELPQKAAPLVAPYLEVIRELNPDGLATYPGSPLLVRKLFRPQDRLSAMELHPEDYETLHALFEGDFQSRITRLDGWLALGAHLPPKEKRGLVLVDPPFEVEGEYERLVDGLAKAHRRFAGGIFCLWYPLKKGAPVKDFHAALKALEIPKMLCAELSVRSDRDVTGLAGSGLIIVNPPYTLEDEMKLLLPCLTGLLAEAKGASFTIEWVRGEHVAT